MVVNREKTVWQVLHCGNNCNHNSEHRTAWQEWGNSLGIVHDGNAPVVKVFLWFQPWSLLTFHISKYSNQSIPYNCHSFKSDIRCFSTFEGPLHGLDCGAGHNSGRYLLPHPHCRQLDGLSQSFYSAASTTWGQLAQCNGSYLQSLQHQINQNLSVFLKSRVPMPIWYQKQVR